MFGGSGFIGQHLCRALVASGASVVNADLEPSAFSHPSLTTVLCDVRDRIHLNLEVRPDAVFNLAAIHRSPGHETHEYFDTNIPGAINVTNWCDEQGVDRICFTSSISVYGAREEQCDEHSHLSPNIAYGESKVAAEDIHRRWAAESAERKLVIVRPAVIFGAGEKGNFTRLAKAMRTNRFFFPGRTDTIKASGYVGDLVDAIGFAMALDDKEFVFNFAYPKPYTIAEICETFREIAGYRRPLRFPAPLVKSLKRSLKLVGAGAVSKRIDKLTISTNVVPAALIERGYEWPTDLKTGLQGWLSDPLSKGHFE